MEEWKIYKLGSICKKVCSGGTPKSTCDKYYGGGIPWLNTKEVDFNRIYSTESTISQAGLENSSAKWIDENSVIVAMYGNTAGKVALAKIPLTTNQACCNLTLDQSMADYRFIFYYLSSQYLNIKAMANGAAQQNLNAQQIKDVEVPLPSLSVQHQIADILSSIDDKIELNNRINHNLEEQAQALYKSWFVDFEPFKDDEFVESELGMIPKGWKVHALREIAIIEKETINPQKFPSTIFSHYSIPAYDNSEVPEIQSGSEILSNKFVLTDKSVLFSKLNPRIKRVWNIYSAKTNAICSTEFVVYKALNNQDYGLLYAIVSGEYFYDTILAKVNGATGSHQRFHPDETLDIMFPYNPQSCKKYGEIILPIIQQIENNNQERIRLIELRESILPKLMSGAISINEIDC